jgi:hypothetical protein
MELKYTIQIGRKISLLKLQYLTLSFYSLLIESMLEFDQLLLYIEENNVGDLLKGD